MCNGYEVLKVKKNYYAYILSDYHRNNSDLYIINFLMLMNYL